MFDLCTAQGVPIKYEGVYRDTREPWSLVRHLKSWIELPDLADEVRIHADGRPAGPIMHFLLRWWFPLMLLSFLIEESALCNYFDGINYCRGHSSWQTTGSVLLIFGPLIGFLLCFSGLKNQLLSHFRDETRQAPAPIRTLAIRSRFRGT